MDQRRQRTLRQIVGELQGFCDLPASDSTNLINLMWNELNGQEETLLCGSG